MCLGGLWNVTLPVTVVAAAVLRGFQQPMRHSLFRCHGSVAASGTILAHPGENGADFSATRRRLCCKKRPGFLLNSCLHMSLNPWCHGHGHECRIVSSWAMAVASCVVVVDLPVRQVFLLQAVHCIAAWLGPDFLFFGGAGFWPDFLFILRHHSGRAKK